MKQKANIAIIILAAGSSSRMGQPKQLLLWGKSSLLNHCISQAVNTCVKDIFVVLGANYETIKPSITPKSTTILHNHNWEQGIGGSIALGIKHIQTKGFNGALIMLADQPQVDTNLLNSLISEFQISNKPIIATSYKNGVGVPAIFYSSYFKKLAMFSGDKGARLLIENNLQDATVVSCPKALVDIDTKEDYTKGNLY